LATAGFLSYFRLQELKLQQAEAQRQAAEAKLTLLQSQLEPHMLFNTLAHLRVLIKLRPDEAQTMLDQLIAFLRATLHASRTQSHALADEFARLADYLALMQVRMQQRLRVELQLPPELAATPVPPLLLQPLVENAIKHGLEPNVDGGQLRVAAQLVEGQLVLTVSDSGVGVRGAGEAAGTGFGLSQIRERLAHRYGPAARLELSMPPEGGCAATVRIPLP
jgi:LytS/YehU family sensor histidine kinase